MKSPQQKKQSFKKEMKGLKKEGSLKEEKKSFFEVLREAVKQESSSQ